jgi:hypothetical protein
MMGTNITDRGRIITRVEDAADIKPDQEKMTGLLFDMY